MPKQAKQALKVFAVTFLVIGGLASLGLMSAGVVAAGGVAAFATQVATLSAAGVLIGGLLSKGIDATKENFGTKVSSRQATAPRQIVYGECRVGGTITHIETSGTENSILSMVVALAGHEIESLEKVFINDEEVITSTSGGFEVAGNTKFTNGENDNAFTGGALLRYIFKDGSQTTSDTNVVANSSLTTDDKFLDVAYVFIQMVYDSEAFGGGIPPMAFVIKGKKVFDPRDTNQTFGNESTYTFSNNPALCVLDYVTNTTYGLKATADEILTDNTLGSFKIAANTCDSSSAVTTATVNGATSTSTTVTLNSALTNTLIDVGHTVTGTGISGTPKVVKRVGNVVTLSNAQSLSNGVTLTFSEVAYTSNGFTNMSADGSGVIEGLLSAMAGKLSYINGKFIVFAGASVTPDMTITDDSLLAPIQIVTKQSTGETYNAVKSIYVDANNKYVATDAPTLTPNNPDTGNTFLSEDTPSGESSANYKKTLELQLPFTDTASMAQRLQNSALLHTRKQVSISVMCNVAFMQLQPFDWVYVTNERLNYTNKTFEVLSTSLEFIENEGVKVLATRLELKEISSSVYTFASSSYENPIDEGSSVSTGDFSVAKPTLVTASDSLGITGFDIDVNWTNVQDDNIAGTEVLYGTASNTYTGSLIVGKGISKEKITGLKANTTYYIALRHFSSNNVYSAKTNEITRVIGNAPISYTAGTSVGSNDTVNIVGKNLTLKKFKSTSGAEDNENYTFLTSGNGSLGGVTSFQNSDAERYQLYFGEYVGGDWTNKFIKLDANWDLGKGGSDGSSTGVTKLIISGSASDDNTGSNLQSNTIATFEVQNSDGSVATPFVTLANTTITGSTTTPIVVVSQGSAPSTTTNKLYNVGGSLFWNGSAVNTGAGDITSVIAGTNLNGGGSSGDVTLNLNSTITGNHTFSNNVIISGNLTVSGTTTTVDTTNLDVKDKNITLNYGTGDTSSTADGAGITIQDAVSSGNDASLTWRASDDKFIFSHPLRMFGQLELPDNIKLIVGDGNDLQIYHNATDSYIENATGNIEIRNNTNDGDINFRSDNGSGGLTTYFAIDGGDVVNRFYKDAYFTDNVKAKFGSSSDLQIYHDATDTFIKNDTGILNIASDTLNLERANGSELYLSAFANGSVYLYHNGNAKLSTTSTGIDVTGTTVTDGIDTSSHIYIDNDRDINFRKADGTTDGTILTRAGGNATRFKYGGNSFIFDSIENKDWRIYNSSGDFIFSVIPTSNATSSSTRVYGQLQIGTTTVIDNARNLVNIASLNLNDNKMAIFGNGDDLQILHDSAHSHINNYNGDFYITQRADDKDIIFRTDDGSGGFTPYITLDGSTTEVNFHRTTKVDDNFYLGVGAGPDLYLMHDGTNSFIKNNTGNLTIQNNTDDGNIIFRSDDGSGGTKTYFYVEGSSERTVFTESTRHNDNVKSFFGSGSDLQIYHDSSTSFIKDTGVGNLEIWGDGGLLIKSGDGTEFKAKFLTNEGVELYYNNSKKLETTNTGATVYGYLATSSTGGLFLPDNAIIQVGNSNDLQIYHDGTNSVLNNTTGNLQIYNNADDKDIQFIADDGSGGTATYFYLDGSGTRTIFEQHTRHIDNIYSAFGTDADLRIFHDGTNSKIQQSSGATGDLVIEQAVDDKDVKIRSDDGSGGLTEYFRADGSTGEAKLYNYGNLKFKTSNTGIDVTGTTVTDALTVQTVQGNIEIANSSAVIDMKRAGTNYIVASNSSGNLRLGSGNNFNRLNIANNGDISFYEDTGTSQILYWDASAESLGIGNTTPAYKIDISNTNGGVLARFKDSDSSHNGIIIAGDVNAGWLGNSASNTGEGIYYQNSINAMRMYANSSEIARLISTGLSITSGSLQISATDVITSARRLKNLTLETMLGIQLPAYSSGTSGSRFLNGASNSIVNHPISGEVWHDIFAFRRFYNWTYETSTDGNSFTSATINDVAFDHRDVSSYEAINSTIKAVRWIVQGVQYAKIKYFSISADYSPSAPNVIFKVESSSDGNTWTTRVDAVTTNLSTNHAFFKTTTDINDDYLRITLTKETISNTSNVDINRLCAWSYRSGDQGKGKEFHLPFKYVAQSSIDFVDNQRLRLGDGNDLQLYHNATNNYIESHTGQLYINQYANDSDVYIQSDNGSGGTATYFLADGSEGSVKLYHYGSKKLETSSTGTNITGALSVINNGEVRLNELASNGSNYVALKSATSLGVNTTYTLPTTYPANSGSVLISTDAGVMSWSANTVSTFSNGADNRVITATGASGITGEVNLTFDGTTLALLNTNSFVEIGNTTTPTANIRFKTANSGTPTIYFNDGSDQAFIRYGHGALNGEKLILSATTTDITGNLEIGDGHLIGDDSFDNLALVSSSGENIVVGANNDIYFTTGASNLSSTGTTRLIVKNDGKVGIGTVGPQTMLQIVGSGNSAGSVGGTVGIRQKGDTEHDGITITSSHGNSGRIYKDSSGNMHLYNTGGNPNDFVITNAGNIGISTSSPTHKLTVAGTTSHETVRVLTTTGNANLRVSTDNSDFAIIGQGGSNRFDIYDNNASTTRLSLDASGNLLVGKTNTTFGNAGIEARANGNFRAIRDGANVADFNRLTSDGNIVAFYKDGTAKAVIGSIYTGFGTGSPATPLHVYHSTINTIATFQSGDQGAGINLVDNGGTSTIQQTTDILRIGVDEDGAVANSVIAFRVDGSEKSRIDEGARLLVGTTSIAPYASTSSTAQGIALRGDFGMLGASRPNNYSLSLNRADSDGDIINLRKNGSTVGSIGTNSGYIRIGTGDTHLLYHSGIDTIIPYSGSANRDDAISLGYSGARFKDLHLSGTANVGQITVDSRLVIDGSKIYDTPANGNNKGFGIGGAGLVPVNGSGTNTTNLVDIGTSTYKFKDLHLSGNANIGTNLTVQGTLSAGTLAPDSVDTDTVTTGIVNYEQGSTTLGSTQMRTATTTSTSQGAVVNLSASFKTVKFLVQITNTTNPAYHVTEITVLNDGTNQYISEYGTILSGSSLASFDADKTSTNLRLLATPTTTDTLVFKIMVNGILS